MNKIRIAATIAIIVAIIAIAYMLYSQDKEIKALAEANNGLIETNTAIITSLGIAGVLERGEDGQILVNRLVRFKDLPQQPEVQPEVQPEQEEVERGERKINR